MASALDALRAAVTSNKEAISALKVQNKELTAQLSSAAKQGHACVQQHGKSDVICTAQRDAQNAKQHYDRLTAQKNLLVRAICLCWCLNDATKLAVHCASYVRAIIPPGTPCQVFAAI